MAGFSAERGAGEVYDRAICSSPLSAGWEPPFLAGLLEAWRFFVPGPRQARVLDSANAGGGALPRAPSLPVITGRKPFSWMRDGRHVVFSDDFVHSSNPQLFIGDIERDRISPLTAGPAAANS